MSSHKFKDNKKREWILVISIPAAKRIKEMLGVDILDIDEGLKQLSSDPILLCDVLFILIEAQADKKGVTDEDFGGALAGEGLQDACESFIEALINFSPPKRAKILRAMQETAENLEETLTTIAMSKLTESQETFRQIQSGRSSQGSPVS